MQVQLNKFIENHLPSQNLEKASKSILEKYKNLVPESLLELWREYGFGFYGNGFLNLINPDDYHETLCNWLMRDLDNERIPIMITAFGTIIYYRMLGADDDGTIIAEDVAFIEPNYSDTGVLSWTLDSFFNEYLIDLENSKSFYFQENFERAKKLYGNCKTNEMYFFVPALRLGGNEKVENIDKGNALVHLEILLQLALDN